MTCKGICICHKVSGRYVNGHCNIFIKYEGLRCPCCGCQLRMRPRYFRYKALTR